MVQLFNPIQIWNHLEHDDDDDDVGVFFDDDNDPSHDCRMH